MTNTGERRSFRIRAVDHATYERIREREHSLMLSGYRQDESGAWVKGAERIQVLVQVDAEDADAYRLGQAEQLLRDAGYVPVPSGEWVPSEEGR